MKIHSFTIMNHPPEHVSVESLWSVCPVLQEVRLSGAVEELELKEAGWQQVEAGLQGAVASLEQQLELEREQHNKEV